MHIADEEKLKLLKMNLMYVDEQLEKYNKLVDFYKKEAQQCRTAVNKYEELVKEEKPNLIMRAFNKKPITNISFAEFKNQMKD